AKAAKTSPIKKTDDVGSYVYRTGDGEIGIPAKNFKACLREAGRSLPDPRSPRKSARDLVQSAIQIEPFIASLGRTSWDVLDVQRVVVTRTAVSRTRPMFREGWQVGFGVVVLAPEYVSTDWLHDLITRAGRFVGVGLFGLAWARSGRAWSGARELLWARMDMQPPPISREAGKRLLKPLDAGPPPYPACLYAGISPAVWNRERQRIPEFAEV